MTKRDTTTAVRSGLVLPLISCTTSARTLVEVTGRKQQRRTMQTLDLTNKNVTIKECDSVPELSWPGRSIR